MAKLSFRIVKWALAGLAVVVATTAGPIVAYLYPEYRELPSSAAIRSYHDSPAKNSERAPVRIKDLPTHVPQAFLAADRSDYLREGLPLRTCLLGILGSKQSRCLDQLIIDNAKLTLRGLQPELSLQQWRLRSLPMIWKLEATLSRHEILEVWINKQYFGHGAYGISGAAQFFYSVAPDHLSIAQSAMLAALIKAPNFYDPFRNPERAKKRRDWIFSQMFERGMISAEKLGTARNEPLAKR